MRNESGAVQPPRNSVIAKAADGEHAEIFAEEKQRELEAGIFDVIAGDDFRIRLPADQTANDSTPPPPRSGTG